MKYGYNKCLFAGNLGRDPEVKYTQGGTAICKFSLACNEKRKAADHVEWVNVATFGKLAEICGEYLHKGDPVLIDGKLSTSSWEKGGQTHYRTEVVANEMRMLGEKQKAEEKPPSGRSLAPGADDPENGDIPF